VLITYADDASIFAALQAGARGHLTKEAGPEEIAAAIERVAGGPAMLDPIVQARLLDALDARRAAPPPITPPGQLPGRAHPAGGRGARADRRGLSNAEIAERLVVRQTTVKTRINRIFAKTGVRDRAQAVTYANRHGIARP